MKKQIKLTLVTNGAHVEQFWDSELGRELQHLRARTEVLSEEMKEREKQAVIEQLKTELKICQENKSDAIGNLTGICRQIDEYQNEGDQLSEEIFALENSSDG